MLKPRLVWELRDPRNPGHIAAAMATVESRAAMHMTETTQIEVTTIYGVMQALGMTPRPIPKAKVVKQVDVHDSVVIGSFFHVEDGMAFHNNVLVKCTDCKVALQIRPGSQPAKEKLCLFCSAERAINGEFD